MAETELKKGKHSMKTILEKAKKWLASVRFEIPAFCELCRTVTRLVVKTVKKEDSAIEKSAIQELRTRTKNAQIAFGGILVVLTSIMFIRGCGNSQPQSGIIHADGDLRKFLAEQHAAQQRRDDEIREREKIAEENRKTEEAKLEAENERRKQKHDELGAWYRAERKKLEETKKAKHNELEKLKYNRAHDILVENNWPQIKFPPIGDITISEPLLEKYKSYALTECPISITNVPIFTSMRIDGVSSDGIVTGIRLNGRVPMTVDKAIAWMQVVSKKLDESWGIKHINLGKDQIFTSGEYEIAAREWEGLPTWHALFQCQVHKTDDGQMANFTLDINSYQLPKLVREQLDKEFWKAVEKLEANIKAQEERLGEELQQRQSKIK